MKSYPIWKILLILVVILNSILFSIPTFVFKDDSSNWFFEKKVNLGLDLQGGSHLLL